MNADQVESNETTRSEMQSSAVPPRSSGQMETIQSSSTHTATATVTVTQPDYSLDMVNEDTVLPLTLRGRLTVTW